MINSPSDWSSDHDHSDLNVSVPDPSSISPSSRRSIVPMMFPDECFCICLRNAFDLELVIHPIGESDSSGSFSDNLFNLISKELRSQISVGTDLLIKKFAAGFSDKKGSFMLEYFQQFSSSGFSAELTNHFCFIAHPKNRMSIRIIHPLHISLI